MDKIDDEWNLKMSNLKKKIVQNRQFSFTSKKEKKENLSELRNIEFTFMKHHTVKPPVAQLSLARSTHQ